MSLRNLRALVMCHPEVSGAKARGNVIICLETGRGEGLMEDPKSEQEEHRAEDTGLLGDTAP